MRSTSLLWLTAVAALAVGSSGCGRDTEDDDFDEEGLTAPSSSSPQATLAPAPTPAPAATPAPSPTPTPATIAYDPDVRAVLDSRCVRCHSGLGSYRGALNYVRPGDAGSVLVQVTGSGGSMARYLGSTAEAELIRQWVLAGAPERR